MRYAYIFDPLNFSIKEIIQLAGKNNIEDDEETNTSSIFYLNKKDANGNEKKLNAQELDLIFIKQGMEEIYQGVITRITDNISYIQITAKNILNIFDEKIELDLENLIKTTGIEDFICSCISKVWSAGPYAQNFIMPKALTHTPYNISVSTENGIFNLATFMNNCKKLYDLNIEFKVSKYEDNDSVYVLIINVSKKEENAIKIIDLNSLNKSTITENYSSTILACVTALGPESQNLTYFLKNDRTITEDGNTEEVLFGKKTCIYVEDFTTARQEILNQFKSNRYDHYFSFRTTDNYSLGEKIMLKTLKGENVETYISGKKYISDNLKEYKTGSLRVKFLDKFLKEKR